MNLRRITGTIVTIAAISLTAAGGMAAAAPSIPAGPGLQDGGDFRRVSEEPGPAGAVIETFRSGAGGATIRILARRGTSATFAPVSRAASNGRTRVGLSIAAARPKSPADADAYGESGRTVVGDLVALGVPRDEAIRRFGDMDSVDASVPQALLDQRRVAGLARTPPLRPTAAATSTSVPYDNQCATISYAGGKIEGYGCSTLYLVSASGGDWWFSNKYKVSAHSSDTSFYRPQRLFELGWSLGWSANNVVYEWEPDTTVNRNDCGNVTFSLGGKAGSISVSAPICPTKLEPWNLGLTRSGAMWQGIERGTDWEAAAGLQLVHSPPSAAASFTSTFALTYAPW